MKALLFLMANLSFMLLSCGGNSNKSPDDSPTSGVIAIAADASFAPIIDEEIAVFESLYPGTGIIPRYSGETETVNALLKDSVWMGIAARPLSPGEKEYLNSKKLFPKEIRIAVDAIALITNRSNPDSIIGIPTLKDILTGKTQTWRELSKDNSAGRIEVVFDHPNSSTVRYAIDSICGTTPLSIHLQAEQNSQSVIDYVAKTPGALGIIGANWIGSSSDTTRLSFSDKIRVMRVSRFKEADRSNSFLPYQAYIALGEYPMLRNVYILLSEPRTGLASGFTTFIASDRGQRIILKSGLLPATQPIRLVNVRDEL